MSENWTRRRLIGAALASTGLIAAARFNLASAAEKTALAPIADAPARQVAAQGVIRIAFICDTHTTRGIKNGQPLFKPHFEKVITAVNASRPNWILHGGDLTESAKPEEIEDFKAQITGLQAPLDWVYGNHDVGAKRTDGSKGGITEARLNRIEASLGPSFWEKSRGGARVVAINTSLINSGLEREAQQWAFLESALAAPSAIPTLLLLHYPPFVKTAGELEDPYWNLAPQPRARLLQLVEKGGVRAMLAGHLHYPLQLQYAAVPLIVGPAVSFGLPRDKQPVGWTEITIAAGHQITSEIKYV